MIFNHHLELVENIIIKFFSVSISRNNSIKNGNNKQFNFIRTKSLFLENISNNCYTNSVYLC